MSRRRWLAAVLVGIFIAWGVVLLGGRLKLPHNDLPGSRGTNGPSAAQGVSLPEPPASGEVEQSSCVIHVNEFSSGQSVESIQARERRPKTVSVRVTDRDVPARGRQVFSVGKVTMLQVTKQGEKKDVEELFMGVGGTVKFRAEVAGIPEEEIEKLVWSTSNDGMKFVREDGSDFAPGETITGKTVTVKGVRAARTTITVRMETKER